MNELENQSAEEFVTKTNSLSGDLLSFGRISQRHSGALTRYVHSETSSVNHLLKEDGMENALVAAVSVLLENLDANCGWAQEERRGSSHLAEGDQPKR